MKLSLILAYLAFAGVIFAQRETDKSDCVKWINNTDMVLINVDIGNGECAVKNIRYPIMLNRANFRVTEGLIRINVLPGEAASDGTYPKFEVVDGQEPLTGETLSNLRTWGIRKNSAPFHVYFDFKIQKRKAYSGSKFSAFFKRMFFVRREDTYVCAQERSKPVLSMETSHSAGILVTVESKVDCLVFF